MPLQVSLALALTPRFRRIRGIAKKRRWLSIEQMFADVGAHPEAMTRETAAALDARYGLEVDYDSIEKLCRNHGLVFPV